MRRFKTLALPIILSLLSLGVITGTPLSASAITPISGVDTTAACSALTQLNSAQDCSSGGNSVTHLIGVIVNILSLVVGIVAVIMIIIAGIKFITSGGDANAVKSARETLIYALVGVAIVVLAQFMVHFVINKSQQAASNGYLAPVVELRASA